MPSLRPLLIARLLSAILVVSSAGAFAQDAPSFKGKSVDIYTGYSVGGGYDLYARLLARHQSPYAQVLASVLGRGWAPPQLTHRSTPVKGACGRPGG